jgi:hypothetical protein
MSASIPVAASIPPLPASGKAFRQRRCHALRPQPLAIVPLATNASSTAPEVPSEFAGIPEAWQKIILTCSQNPERSPDE